MARKRKFFENYVWFGFIVRVDKDEIQKPQCFFCGKILCNYNMRPGKLKIHVENAHCSNANESIDVMRKKRACFGFLQHWRGQSSKVSQLLVKASYKVTYNVAKQKKPHTIAKSLTKPCALAMIKLFLRKKEKSKISEIPLSNNTLLKRINDKSVDVLYQIIQEIQEIAFTFFNPPG